MNEQGEQDQTTQPSQAADPMSDPPEAEEHTAQDEAHDVQASLDEALARVQELEDQHLRLRAEFDNYRKRTRREAEELRRHAAADLVASLLPVIDNLERATQSADQADGAAKSFIEGIALIHKQFLEQLQRVGLQAIEAVGQPFDPNLHEAVFYEESTEFPDGHVMEELQRGYLFGEKVLRHSVVKVAKGSEGGQSDE